MFHQIKIQTPNYNPNLKAIFRKFGQLINIRHCHTFSKHEIPIKRLTRYGMKSGTNKSPSLWERCDTFLWHVVNENGENNKNDENGWSVNIKRWKLCIQKFPLAHFSPQRRRKEKLLNLEKWIFQNSKRKCCIFIFWRLRVGRRRCDNQYWL